MFPRLREQLGTALDLIVEFSTLGEYRLGVPATPGAPGAPADAPGQAPQMGGGGGSPVTAGSAGRAGHGSAARAAVRRTVAGGAAGPVPVVTPAARRRLEAPSRSRCRADRRGGSETAMCHPELRPRRAEDPRHPDGGEPDRRESSPPRRESAPRRRARQGALAAPEQLCLAV